MSQFYRLYRIARTDFSYFFRTKWLMAILISLSISDMLVTGLIFSKGITSINYFQFLIPGIVVIGLFSAATDTGRRIWLGLREGVVQYYMALPIRTSGLVAAYIISGGLGGIVYSGILLLIASVLMPQVGVVNALVVIPFLFILSTGIAGLAAFFASISRRGEIYWIYAQALQVLMVTVSTVFYPADAIRNHLPGPQYLREPIATAAQYNPLSLAASVLRDSAFGNNPLNTMTLVNLLVTSLPLAGLGALAYWIILRTMRLRGKP